VALPVGDGLFVGGLGVLGESALGGAALLAVEGVVVAAGAAGGWPALSSMVRIFLASAVGRVSA
jgi:hypothetical protein